MADSPFCDNDIEAFEELLRGYRADLEDESKIHEEALLEEAESFVRHIKFLSEKVESTVRLPLS